MCDADRDIQLNRKREALRAKREERRNRAGERDTVSVYNRRVERNQNTQNREREREREMEKV